MSHKDNANNNNNNTNTNHNNIHNTTTNNNHNMMNNEGFEGLVAYLRGLLDKVAPTLV